MQAFPIAIFVLCLTGAFGFVEFDRPCRNTVLPKENFSTLFYTGIWFEILHSLNGEPNDLVQCLDHHYTRRGLQQVFDVERVGTFQGAFVRETGVVRIAFPDETPLRALFNGTIDRIGGGTINYFYRVHATDYTNYAIMWSCTELPNDRSREEVSVLGRSTSLSDSVYLKVRALLEEIGYQDHIFRYILHTDAACLLTQKTDN